jgi:hypothetical protein
MILIVKIFYNQVQTSPLRHKAVQVQELILAQRHKLSFCEFRKASYLSLEKYLHDILTQEASDVIRLR